jgi:malonyl-CoA decarboxylase
MDGDGSPALPVTATSRGHYGFDGLNQSPVLSGDRGTAVREALDHCRALLSDRGKSPGNSLAPSVLAIYSSLDGVARTAFFDGLIERFSIDQSALQRAAQTYVHNPNDDTVRALQQAGEPPRRELFLRLSAAPGAAAWLVRMREHLDDRPAWATIESDLLHVLRLLFNRAALDFQQIDLETPSSVLARLIETEAVHPVNDWREMGRRLDADRRCYGFFHAAWPQEPLIFTEVALTRGITSSIEPILDPDAEVVDPRTCDTAMFYSISNCQPGLRGFAFGNLLLSRAIEQLRTEVPWLRRFATISPIPGFRSWLGRAAGLLRPRAAIRAWLSNDQSSASIPDELQGELLVLCAHYLLRVKEGSEPADPVARFHLGNGARLHRLNSSSDLTPAGIRRSAGLTVNYVYELNELERNAETYGRSRAVHAAREVARLARLAAPLLSNPSLVA